jgi:ADP-ribosylglycohydrolase
LALGPHWVYDQAQIANKLGRVSGYHDPLTTYHPGKSAGDLTHYGDQAMVLLRSVAALGRFELTDFATRWRGFWEDPATTSYRDGATRATLAKLADGSAVDAAASDSSDMGGAGRIGALFLLKWDEPARLLDAVRAQTSFTHGDPAVVEAAEFFARVVLAVQGGAAIPAALRATAALGHWNSLAGWLAAPEASSISAASDPDALHELGLSCDVQDAFGGICHLLFRYPDSPATALSENAMAGGDSAARGLILGLVYGAAKAATPIPDAWLQGLHARNEILTLAARLAQA